mmetsp:Transcript_7756/g.14736  ORF Transcript_7756/g.14736 Transcript_7756/m.14736 type:complete len:410 (+) Transcript_7756:3079-4308(+)
MEPEAINEISRTINRKAWKSEKNCFVCGATLGIALGKLTNLVSLDNLRNPMNITNAVPMTMTYHCKFCYHAVCSDCSRLELLHPESQELEKACKNCYTEAVENRVRTSMATEIEATTNELNALSQALKNEETARQHELSKRKSLTHKLKDVETTLKEKEQSLQAELDDLNDQKLIKQKEIEFIKKQIRDFQAEKVACISEIAILSEELQSINNSIAEDEAKLEQIQDMLDKQEKENARLKKELDNESMNDSHDSLITLTTEDDESEYQKILTNLQYEKLRLENEREKLQFMLKDNRVQMKIKESRISTLKAEITRYSITTQKEFDELTNNPAVLNEHLRLLEAENKELKGQEIVEQLHALKFLLEKQMAENTTLRERVIAKRELDLKTQVQATKDEGALHASKCNCVIQ